MIREISYEDILPIWEERLWVDRKDPIEKVSWMPYLDLGDYIQPPEEPTFFAWFDKDKIVGVNSGHMCADNSYRSRGLWVDEAYRGQGLGAQLLFANIRDGLNRKADFIWSFPRKSSWRTYERVGFKLTSDWIENINNVNAYCKMEY